MANRTLYFFIRNYNLLFNKDKCFYHQVEDRINRGEYLFFPYGKTSVYLGNNWFLQK